MLIHKLIAKLFRSPKPKRKRQKPTQNRTTEEIAIKTIGDILFYNLPQEDVDKWLEEMIKHNAYIPYPQDKDLNRILKERFFSRIEENKMKTKEIHTKENDGKLPSRASEKLQKGANVAKPSTDGGCSAEHMPRIDEEEGLIDQWEKEKAIKEWKAQFRVPPVYTGNWSDEDYANWEKGKEPIKPFEEWVEDKRGEQANETQTQENE